jgi:hypothetical protein
MSAWDATASDTKRTKLGNVTGHPESMGMYVLETGSAAKNPGYRNRDIYISCVTFPGQSEHITASVSGIDAVKQGPFKSAVDLSTWVANMLSSNPKESVR